jgi:hypothetical protein
MADSLDPDPHGTRGSTVAHALDYRGEVKKFSSADILATFKAAQRGEKIVKVPEQKPEAAAGGASGAAPGEVRAFSSSDLMASVEHAKRGDLTQGQLPSTTVQPSAATRLANNAPDAPPSRVATATEGSIKVRSWTDEEPKKEFSFDGLKDALATTLVPPVTPAAAPINLLDLDAPPITAPPVAATSSYAPTQASEWASLEGAFKAMPASGAIGMMAPQMPVSYPPPVTPAYPPPNMPPPSMPPPSMPPPCAMPPG